jgi:hypothetical protein
MEQIVDADERGDVMETYLLYLRLHPFGCELSDPCCLRRDLC